jgi:hypothetical protein
VWDVGGLSEEVTLGTTAIKEVLNEDTHPPEEVEVVVAEVVVEDEGVNNGNEN